MNVGRRNARTRLAHLFCEMAVRYGGQRGALDRYAFPVTQEQLGDAAALTGVHVNRSMKSLRDTGYMEMRQGEVTIVDWPRLARLGDFDSGYLTADTGANRQQRVAAA